MAKKDRLRDLRRRYEALREGPFPEGSEDDEVDALRAELIEYDGYLAGLLDRVTGGERLLERDIHFDSGLRARLEAAVRDRKPPGSRDAARYLHRLDALEELIRKALGEGR